MQMSEATLTAATPGQVLTSGAVVLAELGGGQPQLAILTGLPGNDMARIMTVACPGSDEVTTRVTACSSLARAPHDLDADQQQLAQRLMIRLAADARDDVEQLREQ